MRSKGSNTKSSPLALTRRQILVLALFGVGLALLVKAVHRYHSWKPNVVLISIDTVRADRLGCYGFDPSPSPQIDRIARESYVFEQCYAPSSWTMPSVMSMLTGLYPFNHGLEWVNGRLSHDAKTLAEYLLERGYRTGGVESSLFLQSQFGFGRGFERYEEQPIHDHRAISSPSLTERALGWLHGLTGKPFFLWVHYLDPHYDYLYHPEARVFVEGVPEEELHKEYSILELKKKLNSLTERQLEWQSRLYNGEIYFTDRHVGQLVEFLQKRGLWDETWVVITSDHGEMLGEHGALGHTEWFYEEVLRVPLIVKPPKGLKESRRISGPVSLVDIVPTVLGGLGIAYPLDRLDGRDLLNGSSSGKERWASTQTEEIRFLARMDERFKCVFIPGGAATDLGAGQDPVQVERMKALGYLSGDSKAPDANWLIFDLQQDPGEMSNWVQSYPALLADFQRQARQLQQERVSIDPSVGVDPGLLERIRAFGYLDSATTETLMK